MQSPSTFFRGDSSVNQPFSGFWIGPANGQKAPAFAAAAALKDAP